MIGAEKMDNETISLGSGLRVVVSGPIVERFEIQAGGLGQVPKTPSPDP